MAASWVSDSKTFYVMGSEMFHGTIAPWLKIEAGSTQADALEPQAFHV
jgi:hypothetical protein